MLKQTLTFQLLLGIILSSILTAPHSFAEDSPDPITISPSDSAQIPAEPNNNPQLPIEQPPAQLHPEQPTNNPPAQLPIESESSKIQETNNNPQEQNIISTNTIITGSCNGKDDCNACLKESLSPRIGSPFTLCCLSSKHQNLNASGCP